MTKTAKKKLDKMNRILDSAFKLFTEKSVNATAIDDVVKSAGIAKGTFYLYFKDKYDLLNKLVIHKSSEVLISAYEKTQSIEAECFEDKIQIFINSIIDHLVEKRDFTFLLQKNLSACFRGLINSENEKLHDAINSIVAELEERGYTKDEAEKTLYLITDLTGSVCCDAIVLGEPYSIEEIRPIICRTVSSIIERKGGGTNID